MAEINCDNNCGTCSNWECRCQDCFSLIADDNGEWYCDEFSLPCSFIKECGEYN